MIRGGLRNRLILDSTRLTIVAGLDALGWFDGTIYDTPPGPRRHRALRYIPRPVTWQEAIAPNCIAVSSEETRDEAHGLGGEVEDLVTCYVDVFGESDPLGWQLAVDIEDILFGKMPDIGRTGPIIDVYDLRMGAPVPFTQVEIDDVLTDRAEGDAREWQTHWFMLRVALNDDYSDEFNAVRTTTTWTPEFDSAWQRIQALELAQ
jgi:hypothetical protein